MNGAIGHTYSWIQPGQILELLDDPKKKHKVYKYRLEIVYEDEHIAAINKPAGITVSGNAFKTISNALTFNLKASNGQVIGTSEMYESTSGMENGITSVRNNAPNASVVEV